MLGASKSGVDRDTVKPFLLAFTPRQVLLSSHSMKPCNSNGSAVSLDSDQKALLLRSVARFLNANGFPKTLKKFLSEAKIQIDAISSDLVNLDELFIKYVENCDESKNKSKKKTEEIPEDENVEVKNSTDDEIRKEKTKDKKGKKTTKTSPESEAADSTLVDTNDKPAEEKSTKKSKSKKKKKDDLKCTNLNSNTVDDSQMSDDQKVCKKRKRNVSDDNDQKNVDTKVVEESKRIKIEGVKSKEESQKIDDLQNDSDEVENGDIYKSAEKSSVKKSTKKQQNGSTEPKTAFQRVKVDEVVFTDERLKDNSYWAKSGAESGYGAKAQEVLEQVRGRGFRHEKTKKKRGSYRGGQIDLASHSVKFNYSDEE